MRDPVTGAVAVPSDLAGVPRPFGPRVDDDRLPGRGAAGRRVRSSVPALVTVPSDWSPGGQ